MRPRIAYLGPSGTFCEEAARSWSLEQTEFTPYPSIEAVFAAVYQHQTVTGIVPIENSSEGSVNQTLDLLAYDYNLRITGERVLLIQHNLLVKPGTKQKEITRIISHPQALAQCRQYLADKAPEAELISVASTAEAASRVAKSSRSWAAIGTAAAARAYGLTIVDFEIQDQGNNATRFIEISSETKIRPGADKTSLLLYLPDRPGALFKVLEQFSLHNINMSKIESRPVKTRIGDYLFFIDVDGSVLAEPVKRSLDAIEPLVLEMRLLGSYPKASGFGEVEISADN